MAAVALLWADVANTAVAVIDVVPPASEKLRPPKFRRSNTSPKPLIFSASQLFRLTMRKPYAMLVDQTREKHRDAVETFGDAITCKSGCDYCCHLRVKCYGYEAEIIADYIDVLPEKTSKLLKSNIKEGLKKLPSNLSDLISINFKCPFLIDKKCSIYEVRPLGCRFYHSTNVQVCIDSYIDPSKLRIPAEQIQAVEEVHTDLHREVRILFSETPKRLDERDLILAVAKNLGMKRKR